MTDRQTDIRTWRLYDQPGPKGQVGENYRTNVEHNIKHNKKPSTLIIKYNSIRLLKLSCIFLCLYHPIQYLQSNFGQNNYFASLAASASVLLYLESQCYPEAGLIQSVSANLLDLAKLTVCTRTANSLYKNILYHQLCYFQFLCRVAVVRPFTNYVSNQRVGLEGGGSK